MQTNPKALFQKLTSWLCADNENGSKFLWLIAVTLTVFAFRFEGIFATYFHPDDFAHVLAMKHLPFWRAMAWTPLDHPFPLITLEFNLWHYFFGLNPVAFNILSLLLFSLLTWLGICLLDEFKVGRVGKSVFFILCIFWTLWGAVLCGYYSAAYHEKIATLSILAIISAIRWVKDGGKHYLLLCIITATAASLFDLMGVYTFVAATGFALISCSKHTFKRFACLLATTVISAAMLTAMHLYLIDTYSEMNQALSTVQPLEMLRALWLYFFGNLFMTLILPVGQEYFTIYGITRIVLGVFGALTTLFIMWRLIKMKRQDALVAIFFFGMAAALVAMPSAIRGFPGKYKIMPIKYSGVAFFWVCIGVAYVWDKYFCDFKLRGKSKIAATISITLLLLYVGGQTASGYASKFRSQSQWGWGGHIKVSRNSKARYARLQKGFANAFKQMPSKLKLIPNMGRRATGASDFKYPIPVALFKDVISPPGTEIKFIQTNLMDHWWLTSQMCETVASLRSAVPEFIQVLKKDKFLQSIFLVPSTPFTRYTDEAPSALGQLEKHADGTYTLDMFCEDSSGKYDPENFAVAQISIDHPEKINSLQLYFDSDLRPEKPIHYNIHLPKKGGAITINMLQTCGWALSKEVSNVRLIITPKNGTMDGIQIFGEVLPTNLDLPRSDSDSRQHH